MRIAVPYDSGNVFPHFGKSKEFIVYDGNKTEIIKVEQGGHAAIANLLHENKINVVLCTGIGAPAKEALSRYGIHVFNGVQGNIDQRVKEYLSGNLEFDLNAMCKC